MNRSALKKYAPQARLDFIEAVTMRARRLGLDPELPVSVEQTGEVLLIGGQPFPASVATQRFELARRIQLQGFDAVVEALAYTWFNRLVAIRFMELKGYLSHGYRVLSHPDGQQPEIIEHAQHLDLPGLDKAEVIRLKTAGNQDEALYREILLAQCHELHRNMPFLFEALDDATELLLPDNLLRTDSLIAHLVGDIEEGDWEEVEVIGWLYQFYISDKKDEVMGAVVKSEDIPAATQLFTPNWIVQYLVQNSLGRLWLMANPGSNLKEKMPYYIEPAEQPSEVQAQLDALIKVRLDEDGGTLNPESLTVLDPACGSGHILVEAYNLLRFIYEERGYRLRDIPRLILQKNLYGLDIDDRAAQLAGFALLMKAREDDRRLFDEEGNPPHLNVMAIQQSSGLPDEEIAQVIINAAIQIEGGDAFSSGQLFGGGQLETQHSSGLTALDLRQLIKLFEHGKTYGSLISVPEALKAKLHAILNLLHDVRSQGNEISRSYAFQILDQFAMPASFMALKYDAVVANPPYMGMGAMNPLLKKFILDSYPASKIDIYAAFVERGLEYVRLHGFASLVTMHSWMFVYRFDELRKKLLSGYALHSLMHLGARAFEEISGEVVQVAAFVFQRQAPSNFVSTFIRLVSGNGDAKKREFSEEKNIFRGKSAIDFLRVPGSTMCYWLGAKSFELLTNNYPLGSVAEVRHGMVTSDNGRFVRYWGEVDASRIGRGARSRDEALESKCKWFPYNKGGSPVKWYGNTEYVVNWERDGEEIIGHARHLYGSPSRKIQSPEFYFKEGLTWSSVTTKDVSLRANGAGYLFDSGGSSMFFECKEDIYFYLGLLNSCVAQHYMKALSPTINVNAGDLARIPLPKIVSPDAKSGVSDCAQRAVDVCVEGRRLREESWEFTGLSLGVEGEKFVSSWFDRYRENYLSKSGEIARLENDIDKFAIDLYGLGVEVSADYTDPVQWSAPIPEVDVIASRVVSYAIGCMMGRYSLDEPGLIYARSGNIGFDSSFYTKFPADADGIIPVTDESWFEDAAAERVREFVKVVWGAETLVENMEWLADSLGRKAGEPADEAIRRYLSTSFYKDHLQTYKKRPIYWLFSSGKQKAFECLVYLHRYNEGTLSRMRMEYVVPLQSRMQARIDKLSDDIDSATSSAQQKALQKRKDKLTKQLEELRRFDEKLRPYADKRITLDLDDGVKANYGEFGDLLAEVKAITGGKDD